MGDLVRYEIASEVSQLSKFTLTRATLHGYVGQMGPASYTFSKWCPQGYIHGC